MIIEEKLIALCSALTEKYNLSPNKIAFSKSCNKDGDVVSMFVQIVECAYPFNNANDITTSPVIRINGKKTTEVLSTSKVLAKTLRSFCTDNGIDVIETEDKNGVFQFAKFTFTDVDDTYFLFIEQCVAYAIQNYASSADKFGCCARYVECSDAKQCLHANRLYATACEYRKNLEQGKIFYGENSNI